MAENDASSAIDQAVANATVVVPEDLVGRLQAELRKAQPFPDGTLIRFASVDTMSGKHWHYAAVFAGGRWWFTGQGNNHFPKSATQQEFSALMMERGHLITNLEMATAFAAVEI